MTRGTFECPNCGAAVTIGKRVCRECGSDDATGWMTSDEIDYQSIEIPDGYGPDGYGPDGYGPDDDLEDQRSRSWLAIISLLLVLVLLLVFVWRF